jgi:DNA modification methylase
LTPSISRSGIAADSATQVRSDDLSSFDSSYLLASLIRRYRRSKRPVTVNFRRILPGLNSADRFGHLIHPYPAKLLVHIPFFFLANRKLSKRGDLVLDPFCGSGTVLAEAQLAGRRSYGADANPLARLIARVKTRALDVRMTKRVLRNVLKRVSQTPSGAGPDVVNLRHWFYPSTIRKLQCLLAAIELVRDSTVRDFLFVCFSVCVRKVSLADPRLSVPVKLRVGQYPAGHPLRKKSDAHFRSLRRVDVCEIFERIANTNLARLNRLDAPAVSGAAVEIMGSDARRLVFDCSTNGMRGKRLRDETVQLIITSPPYPGAQKYIRSSSLSLGWLRFCRTDELRKHKAAIIGREEFTKTECLQVAPSGIREADKMLARIRKQNPTRAAIAAAYLNDMRSAVREMHRVLKPGGHIVLVAANNRIAGRKFPTVEYLRVIASQCGLSLLACFVDAIRSRGLMTKRNKTAGVITREWVLLFGKRGS